jgi:hypothetical protein
MTTYKSELRIEEIQREAVTEYRWQWCRPDRSGVWAFGGRGETYESWTTVEVYERNIEPGWWCFLMPLPTILPPKKKTVWRMWVVPYVSIVEKGSIFAPIWCKDGVRPGECSAIRTDKTEEREE